MVPYKKQPNDTLISRPVAIIGMMGVGKTTIGRQVARALNVDFIDSDEKIEKSAGMSVASIFELYGEKAFRDIEQKVIANCIEVESGFVLSTGGGAFMNESTREKLLSHTHVIWLQAGPDYILQHIGKSKKRPLLNEDNPKAIIERLLKERQNMYAKAHTHISCEEKTIPETVKAFLSELRGKTY
jgi:shikimate kinase